MAGIVITLFGTQHTGKSETLLLLHYLIGQSKNSSVWDLVEGPYPSICVVQEIEGTRLGITNRAFSAEQLSDDLKFLIGRRCDVIVCCCKSHGATVAVVDRLDSTKELHWIHQPSTSKRNSTQRNRRSAVRLYELVRTGLERSVKTGKLFMRPPLRLVSSRSGIKGLLVPVTKD